MKKIAGTYFRDTVAQNGITVQAPMDALNCGKVYCASQPAEPDCVQLPVTGELSYSAGVLTDTAGIFGASGELLACFAGCTPPTSYWPTGILAMIEGVETYISFESITSSPTQFEGPPTEYRIECMMP